MRAPYCSLGRLWPVRAFALAETTALSHRFFTVSIKELDRDHRLSANSSSKSLHGRSEGDDTFQPRTAPRANVRERPSGLTILPRVGLARPVGSPRGLQFAILFSPTFWSRPAASDSASPLVSFQVVSSRLPNPYIGFLFKFGPQSPL